MEPTELTCAACGTTWKVIKAGDGPLTCPNCKAVVAAALPAAPGNEPPSSNPASPGAVGTPAVVATHAADPRPVTDLTDADDPGLGAPHRGRMPDLNPPRRGRHPLVTVAVILLLLFLVPVALCSVLFAVCTFAFG